MSITRLAAAVVVFAALISIPAVLLLLAVFYEVLIAPPALVYVNSPFPVETPVVAPGDVVIVVVDRCANDPFAPDPVIYTFTRELVRIDVTPNVHTGIPAGGSSFPHGCQYAFRSALNIVPLGTPNGKYYVSGTSTAPGRFKATVARWQSMPFEVRDDNPANNSQGTLTLPTAP